MKEASFLAQLSCCELQETSEVPVMIETNVNKLWAEAQETNQPAAQESEPQSSSSLSAVSSSLDALSSARHSCVTIKHKAFVALFVPHHTDL